MVSLHNIWGWNLSVLITIIGWLATIEGATLLIYPKYVDNHRESYGREDKYRKFGIISTTVGIVLIYTGWLANSGLTS